jgi:hypothetical protein
MKPRRKYKNYAVEIVAVDGVKVLRSSPPVSDDDPDRWRWMLDGDQWLKLSKAHARRREQWKKRILPAGERILTKEDLKLAEELAELDEIRAGRERGAEAKKGSRKCLRIYDWLLDELKANPSATNEELAESFPKDNLHLYRNDESRFVDDGHGKLSRDGFNRYVTAARRALGIARRSPSRRT